MEKYFRDQVRNLLVYVGIVVKIYYVIYMYIYKCNALL